MLSKLHTQATLALLAVLFALAPAHAKRDKLLDLSFRGPELFSYEREQDGDVVLRSEIPRLLGVSSANVLGEWYAGYSSAGDLLDLSGNSRTLADAGTAPTIVNASVLGYGGNQLQAYSYDGISGRHELAHSSWMNVFDGDFSVVQLIRSPSSTPSGTLYSFDHGGAGGASLGLVTTGVYFGSLQNTGLSPTYRQANGPTTTCDGLYHIVHFMRSNNYIITYVDGIPGSPVECSGYGVDETVALTIGSTGGASYLYNSPIAYTRLQDSALTYAQVQKEVQLFQGVLGGKAPFQYASPTFLRSTTSYVDRATGSTPLAQVPANWPVKTSDGGMLVEASTTQLLTYTGAFSTNWTKVASSIAATSVTLPDGTAGTTNAFHEDVTPASEHRMHHSYSATSGTSYSWSIYVKYNGSAGTPREWVRLVVNDGTNNKNYFFNVRYGYVGSSGGTLTGGYGIKPVGNSWYRIWIWATAGATATGYAYFYAAEADGDVTFDGQNQDSVYVAFPQLQTGAFPTSYFPQPAAAGAVRSADNLTYIPWRISKDLRAKVNATPRLLFLGSESLAGSTVTPTVGSYTFTKNGRPQNDETYAEGANHKYNGSSDYLSLDSADFNPSGNFSVVAAITPLTISSNIAIATKWTVTGDKRGWQLVTNPTGVWIQRSTDGTAGTVLTAGGSACVEVGKPMLITATYSTVNGLTVMVDAITPWTNAATGAVYASNQPFMIGLSAGSHYGNMKVNYLAYYDDYVVSQAEHDAMYNDWKSDGILPLNISSTAAKTKLVVEAEVKGQYSSTTDTGGQYRAFIAVGGAYGTTSATRNNLILQAVPDGSSYAVLHTNGSATDRYIYSAVRTDHNKWTRHKWVVDTADLSLSTYHINGVAQTGFTQMTGTAEFGLRDTLIRIGQGPTGTVLGNMEIKNVRIWAE